MQEKIKKIILKHLNNRTFTGCAVGFSQFESGSFVDRKIFTGRIDKNTKSAEVNDTIFFDVASLTKPLVTLLSILALIKERKIHFDEELASLLPFEVPEDKKRITLEQLIKHSSGLPSHKEYYLKLKKIDKELRRDNLLFSIVNEKLESKPGTTYVYSDLDYMLLGFIVELKSGLTLGHYWREKIALPLAIEKSFYFFDEQIKTENAHFVKTGNCPWSDVSLQGAVNDDNCRAFGRMMGHAGLFSNLEGVINLCKSVFLINSQKKEHPSFRNEDLQYLLKKKDEKNWAYGFDIPTGDKPSSGKYFSSNTVGHLGYTGTSFWIDLNEKIIVTLLTNRVIYGTKKNKIKEMRPTVHNEIMSQLLR